MLKNWINKLLGKNKKEVKISDYIKNIKKSECPICKKGIMRKIRELPRIRSPNSVLPSLLFAKLL